MRQLGEFDNLVAARLFCDVLTASRIEHKLIDETTDTGEVFEIWVNWEDDLPRAEALLADFLANPQDPKLQDISREAKRVNREKRAESKNFAPNVDVRSELFNQSLPPRGALTMMMVLACVVIGVVSDLGQKLGAIQSLFITEFIKNGSIFPHASGMTEIMNGEVWRLVTPIFIHFGFWHLLFNMLWLMDLGSLIEFHKGSIFFILMVVVIASASNVGQYLWSNKAIFGGMSGVVYGLLGYVWMKGKHDPASKLHVHSATMTFMMIWYFLCLSGLIPQVANGAHTVGLVVGTAWGYLTSFGARRSLGK